MEQNWFRLDNAAKIYPAVKGKKWAAVFRVDCVLKVMVDPDILQSALLMTYKRFPTFSVNIKKGLFWYYFEANDSNPAVRTESSYPSEPFTEEKDKGYLFRVLYYGKRVSLEVFHSITDGYGALVFLKTLIFNYYMLSSEEKPEIDYSVLEDYGILYYKDLPPKEETEDSFLHYALKNEELDLKEKTPYKISGTKIKKNTLRVTHVLLSVNDISNLSKKYEVTITQFLTALYIYSISRERSYISAANKLIKVSVPVNLRRAFPSKTLRNFSSYINIEVLPFEDETLMEFNEICRQVKEQMKKGTDPKTLRRKFSGNVNAERKFITRLAPLFIKKIILRAFFTLYGDRIITSTLSNTGNIQLPDYISEMVERFDSVMGIPRKNVINCAVASFKDILSLSFTSVIYENSIIKTYIKFLTENDIEVKVETNY